MRNSSVLPGLPGLSGLPGVPGLVALFTLAGALGPAALAGQILLGELVEAETDAPIIGAYVYLVDAAGERAGGAMTGGDGRFQLRAASPGTYTLRAERIGYATMESEPLELAAGAVRRYRFPIATRPLDLGGIDVAGDRRCRVRPEEGRQVAVLWQEASKALRASRVTAEEELYIFVTRSYRRDLEPRRLEVTDEEAWEQVRAGSVAYWTIEPDVMARDGFMHASGDSVFFYGPDAELLLSDAFLDTHCFGLAEPHLYEASWLGIEFRPTDGRRVPEIRGVLWVDRVTAELRRVEFDFVGPLPFRAGREHAGGFIEFDRLTSGAWYIRSWWIRIPEVRRVGRTERLRSVREDGSVVLEVLDREGRPVDH